MLRRAEMPTGLLDALWDQFNRMPSSNPSDYARAAWEWFSGPAALNEASVQHKSARNEGSVDA
jgi:hypothetical protein